MKRTTTKAGRLVLLWRLRQEGVLEGRTLQALGDLLGVDRSTIMRDLREVDRVEAEYKRLMAARPWDRNDLTVSEFAAQVGASAETVRAMIRDGLIEAHKRTGARGRGGRWWIPSAEVDRFREGGQ
jgi:excisionase family DNA binding protein